MPMHSFSEYIPSLTSCACLLPHRIKLRIPHEVAGAVVALRAALEALVVEVTKDPEYINQLDPPNQRMLNVLRLISKPSSSGINLMANNPR